ncbi:MAG: hypothetical protein PHS74_12420 [Lachnospiraceae bacterium]|nr:hypothetical protein [Lachnospiraceae bacterium]
MSVNGITNTSNTAADYTTTASAKNKAKTASADSTGTAANDTGVVYESSANTATASKTKKNAAIVAQLKADAEARASQLQELVHQMISKQGNSYGQATDMWQFLASGNYTVDAATKTQAQQDISEDGYWGVNKTSDRILDFAQALCGGDPDKMEEMRSAFKKGFDEATKAWGKDLPGISGDTYNAVMNKFDKWQEDYKANAASETSSTI